MSNLKLSTHGEKLIKLYEKMVIEGFQRNDGIKIAAKNVYNSFQLQKFRHVCKEQFINNKIDTVLDYGGGGSDWNVPNFEPTNGESAKNFFEIKKVTTFEPARNLMAKKKSDCVVCMDVLEHVFLADVANIVDELFSLTNKLLVVNVACYKAAALLPNGENAHITVRNPDWWKGVFDTISVHFPLIKVVLICSTQFDKGVMYETFNSKDWNSSETFSIETKLATFSVN
tara:strand:+ start:483 stop:1166 length:684 start_codon:yes stop_codon:yes gene_type:complete